MSAEWDGLARLAHAATPGPWEVDNDDCGYASPDAPMVATPWVGGRRTHIVGSPARPHGKPLPENAEFIAAANPATILRLIEDYQGTRGALTLAMSTLTRLLDDIFSAAGLDDKCEDSEIALETVLETRRERDALAARMPCDGGCNYGDGPMEDCSRHGRPPAEVWQIVTEVQAQRDALRARLAAVEALLADGPDTWEGYDTRDIGHAFLAESVLDFTADLRAALAAPTDTTKETP